MCGRARLSSDVSEIKIAFAVPPERRPTPNFAPSWNLAPTDPAPVVYYDAKDGGRRLEVMRWGLIPYWAKDIKIGFSTINARAEDIDTKPAFREALTTHNKDKQAMAKDGMFVYTLEEACADHGIELEQLDAALGRWEVLSPDFQVEWLGIIPAFLN